MYELLIKNTTIIDGTGSPPYLGSVASKYGKIEILPPYSNISAKEVIDGENLYTVPGFIDPHSHGDVPLGREFASLSKISQGITTHVAGMCGFSMFPISNKYLDLLKESLSIFTDTFPENMDTFSTAESFLNYSDTVKRPENTAFLVGHVTLRIAAMGYDNRKPTADELAHMKDMLEEAMIHGASGFSSGLIYIPSTYANEEELVELCKIVKKYNGVYNTHMRNESNLSCESVAEAISVARKSGVKLIISHHKISGLEYFGDSIKTLKLIHEANEEGLCVSCDQYPYTASMTHLSVLAPPKYYSNGLSGMTKFLKDPIIRKEIQKEIYDKNTDYENYYLNCGGWSGIFISRSPKLVEAEGMTILEYSEKMDKDPFDCFCDIMIANDCVASAIYFCMSEEDVFRIIQDEFVVVGTDGIVKSATERAHPRAYGTFPRAIKYFVKENNILSIEAMIRKMTSLTAEKVRIKNKGILKNGFDSDITVFNYDTIADTADFINSNSLADGIEYVIVNGEIVYKDKKLTGATPGKTIRFCGIV